MQQFLTREQWYSLPSELRIRWYVETKFDRYPPPTELLEAVELVLKSNGQEHDDVL